MLVFDGCFYFHIVAVPFFYLCLSYTAYRLGFQTIGKVMGTKLQITLTLSQVSYLSLQPRLAISSKNQGKLN